MRKRFVACALLLSSLLSGASYAAEITDSPEPIITTEQIMEDTPAVYAKTAGKKAYVSNMEIYLDGEQVKPTAYLISVNDTSAYTYFKLRDLAYLMRGKDCEFSVDYDAKNRRIIATSGEKYTPNGTEMKPASGGDQIAYETNNPIWLDGKKVEMEAYTINDSTYYKLRDLGEVLGFEVGYKNSSRQAIIRTPNYTGPDTPEEEKPVEPVVPENPDKPENPDTPDEKPEKPSNKVDGKLTVLIDVGHGGSDGGAYGKAPYDFVTYMGRNVKAGTDICERDFNLPVALMLRDMLKAQGADVIMSAETDKYVGFPERKKLIESNADKADILISVHHNAFNSKAAGFEVLAQVKYKNGGAGLDFAQILEKHYYANGRKRHAPTVFREGSQGDYYAILRYAANVDMLAVISEYAYIDNPSDIECVITADGLKQEAQAMCNAIIEYFETNEY